MSKNIRVLNEPGTETQFYPQTHEKAVIDGDGNTLDVKITGKQETLVSGENIKTVNGESLLGSGNIIAGDPNAVKYTEQSLTDGQKSQARTNIGSGTYSKPGTGIPKTDMTSTVQTTLDLADSAVQCRPSGEVDPTITPAEYATQEELAQLDLELHNLSGKYYGVFLSSALLPEGDSPGYAFVGSEAPFAIWNYDGDEWANTGATIDSVQGEPGVGFDSIATPTPADGTAVITLSNGDTITLYLNHDHLAYPKYYLCADEAEYTAITTKDPATLYLIPES